MLKGQDILLLFKLASLRAQEEIAPTGHLTMSWGGIGAIDLIAHDESAESAPPSPAMEPAFDVGAFVGRIIDANSQGWQGWVLPEDLTSDDAEPQWSDRYTLRSLAEALGLSKSEISNAIARCREAGLLTNDYETSLPKVNRHALLKISEHALKYFFPVKPGAMVRGIPTGFASPVLSKHLKSAGGQIHVWPDPEGVERGQAVEPLYKTVPEAVKKDRTLYHYLALLDSIRMGGPREVSVALPLLKKGLGL